MWPEFSSMWNQDQTNFKRFVWYIETISWNSLPAPKHPGQSEGVKNGQEISRTSSWKLPHGTTGFATCWSQQWHQQCPPPPLDDVMIMSSHDVMWRLARMTSSNWVLIQPCHSVGSGPLDEGDMCLI